MKHRLFDVSAEFYTWYMASVMHPEEKRVIFRALSQLMRLSFLSSDGGEYLTEEVEEKAVCSLLLLKEQLFEGKKPSLFYELQKILGEVLLQNPKAQIVTCATEMEWSSPKDEGLHHYLEYLLHLITPALSAISAQAIQQILLESLEKPTPLPALQEQVAKWLTSHKQIEKGEGQ